MLHQLRQNKRLPRWLAIGLALVFTVIFLYLNTRQYLSFSLQAPDIDRFDQALWNTLRGRFLFSTIPNKSILAYHFSPYMALLSPLLLLWSDVRILFAAQIVGIAATGLILFKMIEDKRPWLALILLGIGWNFLFLSGTNLLPRGYRSEERFRVQSMNDFLVFSIQAIVSLSSGWFLFHWQWEGVLLACIPMVIGFSILLWFSPLRD